MRRAVIFPIGWRVALGMVLVLAATCFHSRSRAATSDAVLDAKRKAAAQLLREGKAADCLAMLSEVIAADDTLYSDHLLMAHANEKLGHPADALPHYRRVIELLPTASTNRDERAAFQEADKKIKQVDPLASKLDLISEEYQKKLDSLEREAILARNMAALERIFRMRGMAWTADKVKGHAFAEVFANGLWQPTGFEVKEKQVYHIRAAGTWRVQGATPQDAQVECTANGTDKRKIPNSTWVIGQLAGQVDGKLIPLGEDMTFVSPGTGVLNMIEYDLDAAIRAKNKGSIQVLISAQ